MSHVTVNFNTRSTLGARLAQRMLGQGGLRLLLGLLTAAIGKRLGNIVVSARLDETISPASANSVIQHAAALIAISGGSGNLTITAGTFTSGNVTGASDTIYATNLVAAVAASASALRQAYATNALMSFTFSGLPTAGQAITVANRRLIFRATAAADGEITIGGTAAATATNTAAAINRDPVLALQFCAVASGSVVFVGATSSRPLRSDIGVIVSEASNVAATVKTPTVGATLMVVASVPGEIGNNLAVTGTGTGLTVVTSGSTGRAGGGSGGGSTTYVL